MSQTIHATTEGEFSALVKALEFLAKNPMKRERHDQSVQAMSVIRFTSDPEARTVSFALNPQALVMGQSGGGKTATADELLGMAWWNVLDETQRQDWMARAGNTGVAADAWAAFKRHSPN